MCSEQHPNFVVIFPLISGLMDLCPKHHTSSSSESHLRLKHTDIKHTATAAELQESLMSSGWKLYEKGIP